MTPGPCPVPPSVRLAIARPVMHHRSEEYHETHKAVISGLKKVFKTEGDIFIFAASGTGAMEAAVANTLSPGDSALVILGGKFAERWADICEVHGAEVKPIEVEWGRAVRPGAVERALAKNPGIKAVFATLCETSTTVKTDIEALARITASTRAILVVDAISGLASSDLQMDNWGVDVAISAGQKGLMVPTGLSFAAMRGAKARAAVEESRMPKYYFDWRAAREAAARNETAWSAPASMIAGLRESLDLILAEGVDNVIARHAVMARACRAGVTALGLRLLAPDAPADGVTGVWIPEGISAEDLKSRLAEECGVLVAGGQGKLKGRIIRIAHLGYCDIFNVLTAVSALEIALSGLGYSVEPGKGAAAVQKALTA